MTAWTLVYDRFDPRLEPLHEALWPPGERRSVEVEAGASLELPARPARKDASRA